MSWASLPSYAILSAPPYVWHYSLCWCFIWCQKITKTRKTIYRLSDFKAPVLGFGSFFFWQLPHHSTNVFLWSSIPFSKGHPDVNPLYVVSHLISHFFIWAAGENHEALNRQMLMVEQCGCLLTSVPALYTNIPEMLIISKRKHDMSFICSDFI